MWVIRYQRPNGPVNKKVFNPVVYCWLTMHLVVNSQLTS